METIGSNTFFTLEESRQRASQLHMECREAILRATARVNARPAANTRQDWFISHGTLLQLMGMMANLDPIPSYDPHAIHVTVKARKNLRRIDGFRFHHWSQNIDPIDIDELLSGVSPLQAICQMAQYLSLTDLVIVMDWMTCANETLRICTHKELEEYIRSAGRFIGVSKCRAALNRSKPGTDSPQETLLRLAGEDYGLPAAIPNYRIFDHISGTSELTVDIAYPDDHVVVEYDGRYHYTMDRWEHDLAKRNRLRALGYEPFVATHATLANEANRTEFLRMVASAIMEHRLHGNFQR